MPDAPRLPRVDHVAAAEGLSTFPPAVRTDAARAAIAEARAAWRASGDPPAEADLVARAVELAYRRTSVGPRRVVNATGVLLHTGLGRARLAEGIDWLEAAGAVDLEFDLETGRRGDRQDHVRELLTDLTGAEDAIVVNNAAAGVVLALAALAAGRDVLLSRGQMVEIGGAFRMPDIVRLAGCRLVEVGCTNRTRLADYADAWGPETAAVLRCAPSNFRQIGFVSEAPPAELAALARERGAWFVDDAGSGLLVDTTEFGLARERTLRDAVADGVHLAIASGDKLLGGPQAGLIVGTREAVAACRRHPWARAARIDKLSLAALAVTLAAYRDGTWRGLPLWRAAGRPLDDIRRVARRWARAAGPGAVVEPGITELGSGALPGTGIPTWRVGVPGDPEAAAAALRRGDPPVVGYIERGRLWLDPRCCDKLDELDVAATLGRMSRGDPATG